MPLTRGYREENRRTVKSADQWDEHVASSAVTPGRIEPSSSFGGGNGGMLERLRSTSRTLGGLTTWLNKRGFRRKATVSLRASAEAIQGYGARYAEATSSCRSPSLDAFGRTQRFFNRVEALRHPSRNTLGGPRPEQPITDAETAADE